MNATNQLFGVCDSSGAQKSTVSSPQSVEGATVEGMLNGQPPMNQSSPGQYKTSSSNTATSTQVSMFLCLLKLKICDVSSTSLSLCIP